MTLYVSCEVKHFAEWQKCISMRRRRRFSMSSKVFAFHQQEDMESIKIEGSYDKDQQLWIGGAGISADGTLTSTTTTTFTDTSTTTQTLIDGVPTDSDLTPDSDTDSDLDSDSD
jgi:hypothetical protein